MYLYCFYFSSEFLYFTDDVLISSLDILDIGDSSFSLGDHTCEDHRHSGSEVP